MSERGEVSYIITGAAGFIGSNLTAEVMRRTPGARLITFDDSSSGSFANLVEACARSGAGAYRGDHRAQSTVSVNWRRVVDDLRPAAVFHMAANTDTTVSDEQTMLTNNVEGFRGLLDACVEFETPLVYASSAATYGSPPQARERTPFPEEAAGRSNNVYGFSKWIMENLHRRVAAVRTASGGKAPHVVGLRFFNVFGPGESRKGKMGSMARQIAMRMIEGGRPRIFVDGEQARDQVSVHDVVDCVLAAAAPDAQPGVYNCGSGQATTFNKVVDAVRAGLGVSSGEQPTEYFEMSVDVRAFYQDFTCADLTRVRTGLGWSPAHEPCGAISAYAAQLAENCGR